MADLPAALDPMKGSRNLDTTMEEIHVAYAEGSQLVRAQASVRREPDDKPVRLEGV